VKQLMVCHPVRSEGSLYLLSHLRCRRTPAILRFAQDDKLSFACLNYLRITTVVRPEVRHDVLAKTQVE